MFLPGAVEEERGEQGGGKEVGAEFHPSPFLAALFFLKAPGCCGTVRAGVQIAGNNTQDRTRYRPLGVVCTGDP